MTEPFDYRSKEKAEILGYVRNSINTFVYGSPGIGKTTLIKSVSEEVNCKLGQAVYIDCYLYPTANAVLRETLITLGSVIASKSNYELTKRLREKTKKVKLAIFLDHFENLKSNDILNIFLGLDFCVCLVADSFESYRMMSTALRSRFVNIVKIEKLADDTVSEILKEKANFKIGNELLQIIVNKCESNLTLALNMLKSIEANHGKVSSLEQFDFDETDRKSLSEDDSIILQILKQQKKIPSGELYNLYCEGSEYPKSERSFRNYMEVLCKKGLVKSIGKKRGRFYEMNESNKSLEGLNVERKSI